MTSITIPPTLKTAGSTMFYGIDKISVSCLAVEPPKGSSYGSMGRNCRLFVPQESVDMYNSSSAWNGAYSINPLYPVETISLPKEYSIVKTKSKKLVYSILPKNAGTKDMAWMSANPTIATVDANGIVTGVATGSVEITATAKDGTDVMASTVVKVLPLQVESMTFDEPSLSIVRTMDKTITMTLNSEDVDNKKMVWTSSDESVATIAQDMSVTYPIKAIVTAKKVGKATIKAEAQDGSGISATCEVEVIPLMVSDISAKTTSVVKTVPTKMDVTIIPTEADNKRLKWTSLTPEMATVTEDGMVNGKKMGTAKLQAESTDGSNISKTFDVQVLGLPVSSISLPKESSIIKTDKQKLEYSILPLASDNQKLKWSSNAPTIASVDETSGVITAHKIGDAIITATATDGSGISASTTIHVTPLTQV